MSTPTAFIPLERTQHTWLTRSCGQEDPQTDERCQSHLDFEKTFWGTGQRWEVGLGDSGVPSPASVAAPYLYTHADNTDTEMATYTPRVHPQL